MDRLLTIASLGYLFVSGSNAQSPTCNNVKGFYSPDFHGEFQYTGFFGGTLSVGACECSSWIYSGNLVSASPGGSRDSGVREWFLDTQPDTSGAYTNEYFGLCTEGLRVFDNNVYFFSKEVLQRSLNDAGDCKVMLGEQCRDALQRHYEREAVKYIQAGECPSSGNVEWNKTVPWECAGLVGNSEEWLESSTASQLWTDTANPRDSLDKIHEDNNCDPIEDRHERNGTYAYMLGSVDVSFNQAVRFPMPTFFTFWPNSTEAREALRNNSTFFDMIDGNIWSNGISSQLSCITSNVSHFEMPEADELLAAIPDGAQLPITVSPTPTPSQTATASSGVYPTGGCNSTHGGSWSSAAYIAPRSTGVEFSKSTNAATTSSVGVALFAVAGAFIVSVL